MCIPLLNQHPQFKIIEKPELSYGVNQIITDAQTLRHGNGKLATKDVELTVIPCYAWAHRGEGDMEVWLPIDISAASALPQEAGKWEDNGSSRIENRKVVLHKPTFYLVILKHSHDYQ